MEENKESVIKDYLTTATADNGSREIRSNKPKSTEWFTNYTNYHTKK